MKRIYIKIIAVVNVLFLHTFILSASVQDSLKIAENAYANGDYAQAIALYETALKSNGESAEIYYNLGNAYYKSGQIAPAILNYERALLIKPGDGDIRFNLNLSKQNTIDKIEPISEFFLVKWVNGLQNLFSVDTWSTVGIICFCLFISCLILFFLGKWMLMKKAGFYLGLVLLFVIVMSNIFASQQKHRLLNRTGAIVFAPTVTVKSSPDASGTDLFNLHEGTKVNIKNQLGDWHEVELEDGNVGWIRKKDIEII